MNGGGAWLDANTVPGPNVAKGSSVKFRFTVTNTGNVALTDLSLADSDFSTASCTVPASLNAGANFSCTIDENLNTAGQHTNTATAGGKYGTTPVSDTDDANAFVLAGAIEVLKIDVTNEVGLEGAVFQLWTAVKGGDGLEPGEKIGGEMPTDEFGKVSWGNLPWGDYFVEEVTAPAGYSLTEPAIQAVTIDASTFACDARVQLSTVQNNPRCGGTEYLVFENEPFGDIEVLKIDELTDKPLEDAVFQLWTAVKGGDGLEPGEKIGGEMPTDEFGNVRWEQLAWGNYFVQEVTAPTGYALSDPTIQAATIDAGTFDCQVPDVRSLTQEEPGEKECTGGVVSLTFANPRLPGSIEVLKLDDAEAPLANVTFELFRDANEDGIVDVGESLGQKSTMSDGTATWTDLVWADDYKVVEVSWPTGYVPSGDLTTGAYTVDAEHLLVTVNRVNNRIDIPKLDKTSVPAEGTAVQAGNTITYTIQVKNDGALPLTGQTLVDTLPTGVVLDVASVTPAGDTSAAGKITWTFDLGAYSAKTFTYNVTVTAGIGSGALVNTATWRTLTDKTEHPVVWPIMSLDKSADPADGADVSPGDTIAYRVLVSNTGAGSFSGPMVDTLPDGFNVVANQATVVCSAWQDHHLAGHAGSGLRRRRSPTRGPSPMTQRSIR